MVTGGPTDALAVLAVPRNPDGTSTYPGPFAIGGAAATAQASFDKAVACKDNVITFTLSTALSDFNEMLTQSSFAPVKKSADRGKDGAYVWRPRPSPSRSWLMETPGARRCH